MSVKRLLSMLVIAVFFAMAMACGSDDDDENNDPNNNNNYEQTCFSSHECINDVCECTTDGMEGEPCTDNDACEDECEVCTEA